MIVKKDLRQIRFLSHMDAEMLDGLIPIMALLKFNEHDVVFKENEPAENFYMVKRGKVLLEQKVSKNITVSVGSVEAGESLGWSAFIENSRYTAMAICTEDCELFTLERDSAMMLCDSDPAFGREFFKQVAELIFRRLEARRHQFIRTITGHHEIQRLL